MTVVGGYNYDWQVERRLDTYNGENELCKFTLHYPEDDVIEEDASDEFPPPTLVRSLVRNCEFKLKPVSDMLDVDVDTVVDLNNDALDKAVDDIQKAFNSDTLVSCNLGVKRVDFESWNKEEIDSKGAYYPYIANAVFRIYYFKARSL